MSQEKQPEVRSAFWNNHIQNWQKTDQSQSAYCHEQNLNYYRFTYWRRKFAGQATKKRKPVNHPGFVPVQASTPLASSDLSLTLSNGMKLQGITTSNLPVVKQLLNLLS